MVNGAKPLDDVKHVSIGSNIGFNDRLGYDGGDGPKTRLDIGDIMFVIGAMKALSVSKIYQIISYVNFQLKPSTNNFEFDVSIMAIPVIELNILFNSP